MPEPVELREPGLEADFGAYLDTIDSTLGLPADERAAVRDEIAMHLRDARDEAIAAGTPDSAAVADALRRFGDPTSVGRDLTRARQARPAVLLAAAGAGTRAAAGAALRGFVLGIALVTTVVLALGVALAIAFRAGLIGTWSFPDSGWFTAIWSVALWFAAWQGGRTIVSVVARRSHRRAERVRPFAAVGGGALVAWLAVVWLQAPQNVASVLVLVLVPVVFVIAVMTGSDRLIDRSKQARRASLALLVIVVVAVPFLIALFGASVGSELSAVGPIPFNSMEELLASQGFDMPGRYVPDPPALGNPDWTINHGVARVEIENAAVVSARWHDLRVEAWRADLTNGSLDRAYRAPFAVAPMALEQGSMLVGAVRVDRTRDVSGWLLVVTGTAADGGRDLVVSLGGTNTTFTGSALDWLTAP